MFLVVFETKNSIQFPSLNVQSGRSYTETVSHTVENESDDIALKAEGVREEYDYSGLSGAPVIISDKVQGVIINLSNGLLNAVSVAKISTFLLEEKIKFSCKTPINHSPRQLESTPNIKVLEPLDNLVRNDPDSFKLLHGALGSEKTLLACSYQSEIESIKVIGRYFVKIPSDSKPAYSRAKPEVFFKWLEAVLYDELYSAPPVKTKSIEKYIEEIDDLFIKLGKLLNTKEETNIIIIDSVNDIKDFGSSINESLSVFSCSFPRQTNTYIKP